MASKHPLDGLETAGAADDFRLARVLLPVAILRDVDELVLAGRGGYRTRQEFFAEAVQNLILEVKYGVGAGSQVAPVEDEIAFAAVHGNGGEVSEPASALADGPSSRAAALDHHAATAAASISERTAVEPITDLAQTALPSVAHGVTLQSGIATVSPEPMFGLHNRDFPSLWVAVRLAQRTQDGFVPFQDFVDDVAREAWDFADSLVPLEKQLKSKLTALFPTNRAKPQSAEASFRSFAIGEIARRPNADGNLGASNGLFCWRAVQLVRDDGRLLLGLTDAGYQLLDSMAGLTLASPHERTYTSAFMAYLRTMAPWDWSGFATLLDVARERPDRAVLTAHFNQRNPAWSETVAGTNAAGYVARAREWGLLEPKLLDSRYVLTELGDEVRQSV